MFECFFLGTREVGRSRQSPRPRLQHRSSRSCPCGLGNPSPTTSLSRLLMSVHVLPASFDLKGFGELPGAGLEHVGRGGWARATEPVCRPDGQSFQIRGRGTNSSGDLSSTTPNVTGSNPVGRAQDLAQRLRSAPVPMIRAPRKGQSDGQSFAITGIEQP